MLKQIKYASAILAVILVILGFGIYNHAHFAMIMSRGNFFFQATRNNIDIQNISIDFPNKGHVTLIKKNDLWYVKEADDYFASFQQMNILFKLIRQSSVYRADVIDEKQLNDFKKDAFVIRTATHKNNIIDEAYIQPKKEGIRFHYAVLNNKALLYQVKGDFSLSVNPLDWVQSPLLNIKDKQIKSIKNNNFSVYKRFAGDTFKDTKTQIAVPQIQNFTGNLWYLTAIDIKHAIHFDRKKYNKSQSYEITTLGGLIYLMDIFTDGAEYWVNIQMKHMATVSTQEMRIYKENNTLYNGWFFKISPDIGELINNFTL